MREILIFLGGAMFGSFVAFLTFCMLAGICMKSETKNEKGYGEGDKANVQKEAMPSLQNRKIYIRAWQTIAGVSLPCLP